MVEETKKTKEKNNRRSLGVHLTSTDIFLKYIFPEIQSKLYDYLWVDLYAGEGNLILPILEYIPEKERIEFFKDHVYLFDIQPEMVQKCIDNAVYYNIPIDIAEKNIKQRNNLDTFPRNLKKKLYPIFHITNPPYLYLGYIRKHEETKMHLKYFENENDGYQDLYQIAMINDLRSEIDDIIYIIPSNFIFGASVSNKFRLDFLKYYKIIKLCTFETKIFEFTGTNIVIGFFKRKKNPIIETQEFNGTKYKKNNQVLERRYKLIPKFNYRGGSEFDEFTESYQLKKPIKVIYYIRREDVQNNKGDNEVLVIDTSSYVSNEYLKKTINLNDEFANKVKSNILYVRTVDTGSYEGRAGLNYIREAFGVDGVYVSGNTYRTSPIQIMLEPIILEEDQCLLKDYFNFILEYFREKLDSEFLTTYKYSDAKYTRKYLGLTQVRSIIETFPFNKLDEILRRNLKSYIKERNFVETIKLLRQHSVVKTKRCVDLANWL